MADIDRTGPVSGTNSHRVGRGGSSAGDLVPRVLLLMLELAARRPGGAREAAQALVTYLRDHDFAEVVEEIEDFGRRRPAVFLAGAFCLGFVAARMLKASRPEGDFREATRPPGTAYAPASPSRDAPRVSSAGSAVVASGIAGGALDDTARADVRPAGSDLLAGDDEVVFPGFGSTVARTGP